jgi:hypothetical protein
MRLMQQYIGRLLRLNWTLVQWGWFLRGADAHYLGKTNETGVCLTSLDSHEGQKLNYGTRQIVAYQ